MSKFFLRVIFIGILLSGFPLFVSADELLQKTNFFIDSSYDFNNREKITAVLQKISDQLYFYIDAEWWNKLELEEQKKVNAALSDLTREFENTIYPILTLNYGSEWKPGFDGDARITILIHPMKETASGYFNPGDGYPRAQVITSNQREMIYLSASHIADFLNKSFLAHEFVHLITFNQKDRIRGITEDIWLNEARAEYAPTLLGYDKQYQDSYLQRRVRQFLEAPYDSLTEWQGKVSDYGVLNLFTQYLADHYGKEILIESLKSDKTGISSLNFALKKNGFKEDFSQIFTNWTLAVFVNDCQIGSKYCYLNDNLKNFRITPFIYFLPTSGESTLSVGYLTKEWAGNWQKIIGGKENLKLEFSGGPETYFKVPYIIEDSSGKSVAFLELNQSQKGTIYLRDKKIISLTIIPSMQKKTDSFSDKEPAFQFFWSASTEKSEEEESEIIEALQKRIKELQVQIAFLQAQITAILGRSNSCRNFKNDLYYGMKNNNEVKCLQEFLRAQGPEIYPEGLITGDFLFLTKAAVKRYQAQKGIIQTGYFGHLTRAAANRELDR